MFAHKIDCHQSEASRGCNTSTVILFKTTSDLGDLSPFCKKKKINMRAIAKRNINPLRFRQTKSTKKKKKKNDTHPIEVAHRSNTCVWSSPRSCRRNRWAATASSTAIGRRPSTRRRHTTNSSCTIYADEWSPFGQFRFRVDRALDRTPTGQ